jgi:D-alanyl-lipoteichoic acid acyltransferase DltB (MBOAT superfamily)
MEITSLKFAILAIISIFIFYLLNPKFRVIFLVMLSTGFIFSFSIPLLIYVFIFSLVNYLFGIWIQESARKKVLFRTGVVINLLQLVLLKYASFAIDPIINALHGDIHLTQLSDLIVPIGISYFTLQGIGYLINVKMGWEKPEKNFTRFLLFIIFFPKFLSGPVERSNHFLPQLNLKPQFNPSHITEGLGIMLRGFFKKIIIANHLAFTISNLYSDQGTAGGIQTLIVILIQPLYLYFDFSGYTDIAIGLAKTYGIDLLPNFNKPFLSENMTNFWRRFHISLSSWFNDYIFKQTSFRLRRLKENATTIAVFLTWLLFGIWHGAGWNFMLLGIVQAIAIFYEFRTRKWRSVIFSVLPEKAAKWTGRIFTFCFYGISLTFFFSPDLPTTLRVFSGIAGTIQPSSNHLLTEPLIFGLVFAMLFLVIEVIQCDFEEFYSKILANWTNNRMIRLALYYMAALLILTQIDGASSFIYEMF